MISRMAGEGMNCYTNQPKRGPTGVNDSSRHYLELSTEEEALLTYVGANFEKVIVMLNVANPFECGFLETIPGLDACMYIGFTGTRGADSIPKLLYGEVSPSGHTVDIFPYDLYTNPANVWTSTSYTDYGVGYEDYIENIYVGYRWYETADKEGIWNEYERTVPAGKLTGYNAVVQYPFGYGLSYNQYDWEVKEISVAPGSAVTNETKIDITLTITNKGAVPGREVVAAYLTAPFDESDPTPIEKSYVSLVGFNKTELIQPNTSTEITLTLDVDDFKSYDCYDNNDNGFKGYELEKGAYEIKLMTDSHTVKEVAYNGATAPAQFTYNVNETIKIETDKDTGAKVGNLFTGEDTIDRIPLDAKSKDGSYDPQIPWLTRTNFMKPSEFASKHVARPVTPGAQTNGGQYTAEMATEWDNATVDLFGDPVDNSPVVWGKNNGMMLAENGSITDLGKELGANFDDERWEKVLEQISVADVKTLVNQYYGTKAVASVGKPYLGDLDGPAQIGGFIGLPKRGTGYPTMVMIASTWNPNLAYEFGKSYGDDMKALGYYGVWGWAIDLHRNAFFGRNHESPSEDPMLASGIITNAVKGLNTRGRYCFLKHFALYGHSGNNKWLTEQALREIYLAPFRDAFVEGGALGCMTTYQGIGAEHTETSTALLTGILRKEWNFKGAITTDYIGDNGWCDSILRCGGNLGMGCTMKLVDYSENSSLRMQNRMKDLVHEILYMWLHADYNERQYQANPDEGDTYISSTVIESWVWWKPVVTCLNIAVISGMAVWALFVLTSLADPPKVKRAKKVKGGRN